MAQAFSLERQGLVRLEHPAQLVAPWASLWPLFQRWPFPLQREFCQPLCELDLSAHLELLNMQQQGLMQRSHQAHQASLRQHPQG